MIDDLFVIIKLSIYASSDVSVWPENKAKKRQQQQQQKRNMAEKGEKDDRFSVQTEKHMFKHSYPNTDSSRGVEKGLSVLHHQAPPVVSTLLFQVSTQ